MLNVQSGSISLKTQNGEIPVDKHTRRLFSYVPQGNMLLSGTIRDNLTFIHTDVSDEELEKQSEYPVRTGLLRNFPMGLIP